MQTLNLNIYQNERKIAALKVFWAPNSYELIEDSIKYTKEVYDDLSSETEHQVRKKRRMAGEKPNDVRLTV